MTTNRKSRANLTDWRTIENDREKYAAYLCSREWSVLKEAVRERSHGICELCLVIPQDATHHLTYERKYAERIEDLQAICTPCHRFTHGKSSADPSKNKRLLRYLLACAKLECNAVPIGLLLELEDYKSSKQRNELFAIRSINNLNFLTDYGSIATPFEEIADRMQDGLGLTFNYRLWLAYGEPTYEQPSATYADAANLIAQYVTCGTLDYDSDEE